MFLNSLFVGVDRSVVEVGQVYSSVPVTLSGVFVFVAGLIVLGVLFWLVFVFARLFKYMAVWVAFLAALSIGFFAVLFNGVDYLTHRASSEDAEVSVVSSREAADRILLDDYGVKLDEGEVLVSHVYDAIGSSFVRHHVLFDEVGSHIIVLSNGDKVAAKFKLSVDGGSIVLDVPRNADGSIAVLNYDSFDVGSGDVESESKSFGAVN